MSRGAHGHLPALDHPGGADGLAGAWSGEGDDADPDEVRLTTVGIDVGSSTSQLMVADLTLRRLADSLSSRFVVVRREVRYHSPVVLTPYLGDGTIDASALAELVVSAYREAGVAPGAVDSGAVILTGVALLRRNARSIADRLAALAGNLVCASAGHHLEAVLAAHGSGAVARSRAVTGRVLHVDIGGGTTKLALIEDGEILGTAAMAVGGRLVAYDTARRVLRVEGTLAPVLAATGVSLREGDRLEQDRERALAAALADALAASLDGDRDHPLARCLWLTDPLDGCAAGMPLSFSGGVAEYLAGASAAHGDLGSALARAVAARLGGRRRDMLDAGRSIRATVVGASQFTVQVSGSTVSVDERVLPLRGLPVVSVSPGDEPSADEVARAVVSGFRRLDEGVELGGTEAAAGVPKRSVPAAVGVRWSGDPSYPRLRAVAEGLAAGWRAAGRGAAPLAVVVDGDLAKSLARQLRAVDPGLPSVTVVDGVEVRDLDYIDLGTVARPAGVVPVVVRSLVFPGPQG